MKAKEKHLLQSWPRFVMHVPPGILVLALVATVITRRPLVRMILAPSLPVTTAGRPC